MIRKTFIALFLMMAAPCFAAAQFVDAALVDRKPDPSAKVSWYSTGFQNQRNQARSVDPFIAGMVAAINTDSLRATLQEMQDWGSRFLMNDNNREVATSLADRFRSYGYTDVKLDSFYLVITNWNGLSDSGWQYNVACTVQGRSAPDEIYVAGGHYDSYCAPDPVSYAPGVNDNGSAVAATLEIARVMKQAGYQPEATIRFILFGAEELGLFGSRYEAEAARMNGTDIRYMLNMDMISNNPDDSAAVKIYRYAGYEWAADVAAEATEKYSDLSVVFPANTSNSGSDSYPYWVYGFPSAYFEEIDFSPNWHLPSDTLGNCNVPYLAKVTGGALATLAEQQRLPYPQNLRAVSAAGNITLHWLPTNNASVAGFNIYRSDSAGSGYRKINQAPVTDSLFSDVPESLNKTYYYVITTVNDLPEESLFSNEASGARFNFCDTLLVLANVKGTKATPDSILGFYQAVLDSVPYRWIDVNAVRKAGLEEFSRYRTILWMTNSLEFEAITVEMQQGVEAFMANQGNMIFAGFVPGRFWISPYIPYPLDIPEALLFYRLFRADSTDHKIQSMLFRANACKDGYDTLNIDPFKQMDKNFPGQIYNVDVFSPAPGGNVIYRFDSKYDSTSSLGKMKHRPVGLEYMGDDYKSILLSFPLYYLDTSDARAFIRYVLNRKFGYSVGLSRAPDKDLFDLNVFPNPANDAFTVSFTLDRPGLVRLSLISGLGQTVACWSGRSLERGTHSFRFSAYSLAPGVYQVLLQQGDAKETSKVIIAR